MIKLKPWLLYVAKPVNDQAKAMFTLCSKATLDLFDETVAKILVVKCGDIFTNIIEGLHLSLCK